MLSRNLITYLRLSLKTPVFFSDNIAAAFQFSVSHLGNQNPIPSVDCFLCLYAHTQMNGVLAFLLLPSSLLNLKGPLLPN